MIVDIATPDIDGCKTRGTDAPRPRACRQPRVLMRAVSSVEAEARALAHAFSASFVIKPTNPELLLATVSATLGEPAPQERGAGADHDSVDMAGAADRQAAAARGGAQRATRSGSDGA